MLLAKTDTPPLAVGLARAETLHKVARFSPWTYRLCWLLVLVIHGLVISYCCMLWWLYAFLPGTYLDQTFQYIKIGLGTQNHFTIGRIHLIAMLPHALAIAMMLIASAWNRRLVFFLGFSVSGSSTTGRTATARITSLFAHPNLFWIKKLVKFVYFHLMSPDGLFGIEHKHFDHVLLVREIIETGIQTYQGYRMSWYLPRSGINGAFVALLILNCWSTALAQLLFQRHEAKKRLVCLLCDSLLDLVCSVGIPTTVFLWYWRLYDPSVTGFPEVYWHQDVFVVQVVSELQMVVVSSWMDLATRIAFIIGVYTSLTNMKELMFPAHSNQVHDYLGPQNDRGPSTAIVPATMTRPTAAMAPGPKAKPTQRSSSSSSAGKLHGLILGVWGLVVLVLHLHASSLAVAPNCLLQVRPWGITHPACSLVQTHCYNAGFTGSATELQDAWTTIEPSVVLRLVVRHCPAIIMPPAIQQFTHLVGLKIYNSTIIQWDSSAELNAASHPDLKFVHLVRVNFSNGDLPLGLQAPVFPPKLFDLEFSITNIARLPENLDKSWHEGSTIFVENCLLDEFPDVLVRLKPKHIGLGNNPIKTLPPGAFESPNLVYISIGGTLVSELPDLVTLGDKFQWMIASDTKISFWYAWLDTRVAKSPYRIVCAYATPYCDEWLEIKAGNRTAFSVATSPSARMKLSHPLMENTTLAKRWADCLPIDNDFYPWAAEDASYGLNQ